MKQTIKRKKNCPYMSGVLENTGAKTIHLIASGTPMAEGGNYVFSFAQAGETPSWVDFSWVSSSKGLDFQVILISQA